MAFKVPTLSEVNRTVENGFSEAFYGTSGILRAMVLKVVSKVVAGAVYLVILLVAAIWKNSFIATANVDGLIRKGEIYGFPPKPASRARGNVIVTGTGGTSIPAGTVLVDPVLGHEYELLTSASIPAGTTSVSVQVYSLGFGSEYNLPAETALEFRDAAPGEFSMAVDSEGLYGGSSVDVIVDGVVRKWGESVEDYRSRLKVRSQNQPMGGSVADYWLWAMSFSEVSNCYVVPNWPLTNCVSVFVADFRTAAISLNSTILASIRNYITSDDRREATSQPVIGTVDPITVSFTCSIPVVNDFYKNSVVTALKDYFRTLGPGQMFSAESIRKRIVDFGGVDNCLVSNLYAAGSYVEDDYQLGQNYLQIGTTLTIHGEVVNTYLLDSSITFENMT